jgi:two-component system phosphate regulon sensor histidine kinase PhoR
MAQSLMVIATVPSYSGGDANAGCRHAIEAAITALTHSGALDDHRIVRDIGGRGVGDQPRDRELAHTIDFYAAVLAMASHDLRQPLQVITGLHELLAQKLAAGPERWYLERAQRASTELADKLDQLADALRVQHQSTRVQLEPVPLQSLLQVLAHQLDESARHKRISLRFLRTDAVIVSNAVMLDGILRNLARNALEHTAPGGRVLVGCRRRGAEVRIEVRDNGAGIQQDQLPRLFEAFVRLDAAPPEGLGLGLFIVKRAADYLGHRVWVRSAPGQGCCFTVAAQSAGERADS